MLLNKLKLLNFFKTLLPDYSFIKESAGFCKYFALFQNNDGKALCFISGFHGPSSFQILQEEAKSWGETIWVTPDLFFYRKQFQTLQPLYFIKKEKNSFTLYDRRFLKTEKGLYPLPLKKVKVKHFIKNSLLQKEEDLLFPKRICLFYCEGDSTDHLNNPKHLKSLETRLKRKKTSPSKPNEKFYLWLKKNLDKGPL